MLTLPKNNPLLHPVALLMAGLALSIGWGIRGNYGHETGAMLPGLLTGVVVCLLSQRQDWRERVAYFAMFGGLAWGFGGSMSYMQVIGFAESGHLTTQIFGYYGLFLLGFLWASLGGAGTAIPAVYSRQELTDLCKPLGYLVGMWILIFLYRIPLQSAVQEWANQLSVIDAMSRHGYAVYWLDSDWLQVLFILISLLIFDFCDRSYQQGFLLPLFIAGGAVLGHLFCFILSYFFSDLLQSWEIDLSSYLYLGPKGTLALTGAIVGAGYFLKKYGMDKKEDSESGWLILFYGVAGLFIGFCLQIMSDATGLSQQFADHFVRYYGDQDKYALEELVFNWPNITLYIRDYLGIILGTAFGVGLYFRKYGQFNYGSKLFVYMACGWFCSFLLFPVILDLRMTPPRGDNWAGVLGTILGASIYFLRNGKKSIVVASTICGMIGGIGFSGIAWLKLMLISLGNPNLANTPGLAERWTEWQNLPAGAEGLRQFPSIAPAPEHAATYEAMVKPHLENWYHWQHSNWHSFLEQSYGFVNGLGVIIALAFLVRRVGPLDNSAPRKRWSEILAVMVSVSAIGYLNFWKNIKNWVRGGIFEEEMKIPLFDSISMSAHSWFLFFYLVGSAAFLYLLIRHTRQRIALVPATWLGRGQLLFIVVCWMFVVANLGLALEPPSGFTAGRLLTEGMITLNAILLSVLTLTINRDIISLDAEAARQTNWNSLLNKSVCTLLIAAALIPITETIVTRAVYGDAHSNHSGMNHRFGPKANWIHKPNLKSEKHR